MTTVSSVALDRLETRAGELIARETGSRWGESESADWRRRGPVEIGRQRLKSDYWHRQEDILEAAWKHPRVAVRSANSMGKNFAGADFVVWAAGAGMGGIIIAPTDRQLDIWSRELRRALKDSGLPYELFHRKLKIAGEDRFQLASSSSADHLRGTHHSRGTLMVIDEGQGASVEAVAYDAAFSCATGEGDKILVLGNPAHPGGRFHAISKAKNWVSLKIAASEHPNIAEGRVVIPGGPAPNWPESIAAEYGRDSAFYTAFVEGEFPAEGSVDSLIGRDAIEAAFARHDAGLVVRWDRPVVIALDVARSFARDQNVAAAAQGSRVLQLYAWHSRDLVTTTEKFLEVRNRYQRSHGGGVTPVRLLADASGVGSGVIDIGKDRGARIAEYWGWSPSPEPRFANHRAAHHWHLRTLLERDEAVLPRDERLAEDLLALEWTQDSRGRILMLSKDDLRKALGRSSDHSDSVVMALSESYKDPSRTGGRFRFGIR